MGIIVKVSDTIEQETTLAAPKVKKAIEQQQDLSLQTDGHEVKLEMAPDALEMAKEEQVDFVLQQTGNPVDRRAVAATMESRGLRDVDAVERFQKQDIFDLADEIYTRCKKRLGIAELVSLVLAQTEGPIDRQTVLTVLENRGLEDRAAAERFDKQDLADLADEIHTHCQKRLAEEAAKLPKEEKKTWYSQVGAYLRQAVFTTPVAIYMASILILGYALWLYLYIGQAQGTPVAFGTVFSLLVTGGFVQAMGRLGRFYAHQERYVLVKELCHRLLSRSLVVVLVGGGLGALLGYGLNSFVPAFPQPVILVNLISYFLFAVLWLFLAALSTLRHRPALVTITIGLGITLLLLLLAPHTYIPFWIGLTATNLLAFWWWRRQPAWDAYAVKDGLKEAELARPSLLAYALMPYVAYGLLYVGYLILGRLGGRLIGLESLPFTLWFRYFYGPGSEWLLPSLVLAIIVAFVLIVLTIWQLRRAIYEVEPPLAAGEPEWIVRFLKFYVQGTSFAVPMAIQIASILALGYGLWASLDFDEVDATTVAIGTILSFLVTGGFVQAIGRLGLFYREQRSYILAREISYRLIRYGLLAVLAVGLTWYIVNLINPQFKQEIIVVSLAYYFLLSSLWLFLAVLYTLQQRMAIIIITIFGLVVIGLAMKFFTPWTMVIVEWLGLNQTRSWSIYAAHWAGLAATALLAFLWGHRQLFRLVHWLQQQKIGPIAALKLAQLPRPSIVTYAVGPYFAYGLLYFGYLFMDRINSFSYVGREQPSPLILFFRTPYELGLDWALLSLLLTIALLEYTINEFGSIVIQEQKKRKVLEVKSQEKFDEALAAKPPRWYSAITQKLFKRKTDEKRSVLDKVTVLPHPSNPDFEIVTERKTKDHNDFFFKFYLRQLLLLAGFVITSALITYYGVLWFRRFDDIKQVRDFFTNPVTFWVFYWAVTGYGLLVWGMLNSVFFFFLSRPQFTLRVLGLAFVINLVVGFMLSRMFGYWYSVIGMTLGALFLAVLTTRYALRVFRNLDYYYYSAY